MLDIALQPKQLELARLMEARGLNVATWLGYGGALGGAKSGAIRRIMLMRRVMYPNTIGVIMRRVLADVKENHIQKFWEEFPELRQFYNATDYEIVLPNGSRIKFMYAEDRQEVDRKFYGPEFFDIFIDQAEQFSEKELRTINTRNRWPGAPDGLCKTGLFFNPGGAGTEFLRRIFYLKQYKENERASDYAFIQSYGWDNYEWLRGTGGISEPDYYALTDQQRFQMFIERSPYGRKLNELPPSIRAGHLLGSFDTFAGQYFAGVWDENVCVLPAAQVQEIIQPWWSAWMAQDWGFGDHDCHLWCAAGHLEPELWMKYFGGYTEWPVDIIVIYREYVIHNRAEADLAMDIVQRTNWPEEREHIQRFFLSQDAFGQRARQQGAHSVGQQFTDIMRRYGLPAPEPANQDRVSGFRNMYNCLRQSNMRGQILTQERTREGPALFISANCPNLIASIPLAVRDEEKHEDVARVSGALWEDCVDAARYALHSMLEARKQAPYDVRLREVLAKATQPTQTGAGSRINMNAVHMAHLQFQEQERRRTIGRLRWR